MKLEINSVWKVSGIDGTSDGLYRIIAILVKVESLVLFELTDTKSLKRPVVCSLKCFQAGIKSKDIQIAQFSIPDYQLVGEDKIHKNHQAISDKRYDVIEKIVTNNVLLFDLATQKRVKFLPEHAKKKEVSVQTIYRYLNLFWKFGLDKNALLPAFKRSGGGGKTRKSGEIKRGTSIASKSHTFNLSKGINITEDDKKKILKGLKHFYLKTTGVTLKKAYKKTLKQYYAFDIEKAKIEYDYPKVPTYRQFIYWKNKLLTPVEIIKNRTTESNYLRNKRGVLGSATENTPLPGSCFEIDATVADVNVVSILRRNHVIGRPTLYSVVDKASRMIVGLHVSMEYASWTAARQALVNSFIQKPAYCARYGIQISEADWPCHHIPQQLLCDRGEMICRKPEELVVPMMQLCIAPPYRADFKGIVERRFGILNDELLHDLIGSSRGKKIVRGDKDPRQDAIHTLSEITTMLIDEVLEHNRSIFDELAISSRLLIENDLAATPINFWNIHLTKHRHALKKVDEIEVRAKLLPAVEVSMTRSGILFEDMYYSCERIEKEELAARARCDGRWRMEARVDQDNSSFIYVRLNENEGFTICKMLDRTSMLKDLPLADVYYFQDWKKSKDQMQPITTESISAFHRKNSIAQNANKEQAKVIPLNSRAEKVADIRSRRRKEILVDKENNKVGEPIEKSDHDISPLKEPINNVRQNRILSILKRNKDDKK